jgi:hypothetical protein
MLSFEFEGSDPGESRRRRTTADNSKLKTQNSKLYSLPS